ncbi:MAG: hypothetical protein K0S79_260 [Nitrospira sp.]|jgi:hypothetical protein|nr:hypothetical protein [Nitrospira sp.]
MLVYPRLRPAKRFAGIRQFDLLEAILDHDGDLLAL